MSGFSATTQASILKVRIVENALIRMLLGHLPLLVARQTVTLLLTRNLWIWRSIPQEMFSRFPMVLTSYLAMVVLQQEGIEIMLERIQSEIGGALHLIRVAGEFMG